MQREFRVGVRVDDLCRACKMVRDHTVMAVGEGVVRVLCDFCGSQHNYRGGASAAAGRGPSRSGSVETAADEPFPLVADREISEITMNAGNTDVTNVELERMLRRAIREEGGLTPVTPAAKWRGGDLVLQPGREGVQEKRIPIETFFHKIVMLRNRLRTLEQQVNSAEIPVELKLKLQGYITACYGSLTSFNVLFADEDDRFRGSGKS
jgi:hypothetical protein